MIPTPDDYWEAEPEPPRVEITDEMREQWERDRQQCEDEKRTTRVARFHRLEQRSELQLQLCCASWRSAAFKTVSELPPLPAFVRNDLIGVDLVLFDAVDEIGEREKFMAWVLSVSHMIQLKKLINAIEHSVVLFPATDDSYMQPVYPDADYLLVVVDDWVEIND